MPIKVTGRISSKRPRYRTQLRWRTQTLRTRDVRRWLVAISLCVMLGGFSMAYAESAPTPPSGLTALAQPAAMPSFQLPATNGDTLDSASLAGQVVIVRFWATW